MNEDDLTRRLEEIEAKVVAAVAWREQMLAAIERVYALRSPWCRPLMGDEGGRTLGRRLPAAQDEAWRMCHGRVKAILSDAAFGTRTNEVRPREEPTREGNAGE